jgi:hypothetical protein
LRKRGDLTLWFSEEAIAVWRAPTSGAAHGASCISLSMPARVTSLRGR